MTRLVLASASKARRALLTQAGLAFDVTTADIDEDAVIQDMKTKSGPHDIALELARQKALSVARKNADALVIGGDQVLSCEGRLYTKAQNDREARKNLETLRGKTHHLVSAVCVAHGGDILWEHAETAGLTMKNWSADFLDTYMSGAGDALTKAVGCYELEGLGAWLFDKIEGDYFTILGLPLLPLLQFLETKGFGP